MNLSISRRFYASTQTRVGREARGEKKYSYLTVLDITVGKLSQVYFTLRRIEYLTLHYPGTSVALLDFYEVHVPYHLTNP